MVNFVDYYLLTEQLFPMIETSKGIPALYRLFYI